MNPKLRFGAFIAPFHPMDENPTLAIERDLELVQWLDTLGYDEAWIGEHHSAGLRDHRQPRGVHRRRGRAHQAHPPRHRRLVPALPPPVHAGRPDQPARPHDPRAGDVRRRPRRALVRRLHDGHPIGPAARHDGRGAGRDRAPAARRGGHPRSRLVQPDRGAAADDAAHSRPQRRDRGGQPGLADRRAGGGPPWRWACSRSAPPRTAASTRSPPTGRSPRSMAKDHGTDHGPRRLAAGRSDAHRRDQASRPWPTSASAWRSGSTISARSPTCRVAPGERRPRSRSRPWSRRAWR